MKPDWDRLAKNFEKNGFAEDVLIAEVDCTVHDQLCKEHEVSGYPTIMTFKKGRPDDGMHYDESLTALWNAALIELAVADAASA